MESRSSDPNKKAGAGDALDFSETFPHLPKAPIVEAALDFRAQATVDLDEGRMREELAARLSDYPEISGQRIITSQFSAPPGRPPEASARDLGFIGVTARTSDRKQIVQFHKDGFLFSRLHPYDNWDSFVAEALRLWGVHIQLTQPEEVRRMGVRFINRIPIPVPGAKIRNS